MTTLAIDDEELDRLYGLPLKEFVPERNAMVKRLRQAGSSSHADEVKKLVKPSVSAWAINQLARQRRDLVLELLASVDRVRAAQLGALEGVEDAPSLPEAMRDEKEVVARLEEATPGVLSEGGYVASQATIDRTLRSLRAAAADPEGRKLLEVGRLSLDYEPAGFANLAAGIGRAPPPPPAPHPETRRARDTIDLEMEAHRRQAELKRAEQEARRQLDEERRAGDERRRALQKKMDGVRRGLESARDGETRLEREHHVAQRDLQEAERRLREVERLATQTAERLDEARQQRESAEAQIVELREALEQLD